MAVRSNLTPRDLRRLKPIEREVLPAELLRLDKSRLSPREREHLEVGHGSVYRRKKQADFEAAAAKVATQAGSGSPSS